MPEGKGFLANALEVVFENVICLSDNDFQLAGSGRDPIRLECQLIIRLSFFLNDDIRRPFEPLGIFEAIPNEVRLHIPILMRCVDYRNLLLDLLSGRDSHLYYRFDRLGLHRDLEEVDPDVRLILV